VIRRFNERYTAQRKLLKEDYVQKLVFAFVLFAFLSAPVCLDAQSTSVTFLVCNAGKTDVDVFFSQSGKVTSNNARLGECATMAHSEGAMAPAYVGIAFTDSRGQWGAARRHDILLDSDKEAFEPANQNVSVKHGNSNVTLPMKLYFHPRTPECHSSVSTPMAQYPSLAPTAGEKARAEAQAASMATVDTTCENLEYKLYVEAYPDTKELAFKKYCEACEQKAATDETPEERATRQQRAAVANSLISGMERTPGVGGLMMRTVMNGVDAEWEKQEKQREADLAPPMRVNWNDMQEYLYLAYRQDSRMKPVNQHIILEGTIQSINVRSTNPPNQVYDVYFKDDPKRQFAFCTSRPDIFQDVFGANFATAMPGKTVEVQGWLTKGCRDVNGGIQITLMRQLRVLGPGQTATVAHVWSPAENAIPATNSAPTSAPIPTPAPAGAAPVRGITRGEAAARTRNEATTQPSRTPAPTPNPIVRGNVQPTPTSAPAAPPQPAPSAVAATGSVDEVIQLVKGGMPEPLVIKSIQNTGKTYRVGTSELLKLQQAGVSENIIEAMMHTTAPAATPATAPVPTVQAVPNRAAPATPPAQTSRAEDPMVQSVLQLLRAKTPEPIILETILTRNTPHTLSGADRAKLEDAGASERLLEALANPASIPSQRSNPRAQNQKSVACQAQAGREFPNDSVARAKAFAACMQSK
jgi:hypothetical protein